ncbi:hypothetical protein BGY98DRAFT_650231 [Russula aff. rugulosa BPL654]|nr:hypothetical protein BGY98DRAFT_650231 [Russula aff. rugulosa BPL654]
MQTSANPRRQSKCVDRIPCPASHSYSITYILTQWPTPPFFTPFLDCTYPPPSISPLSAEDDDAKLDTIKQSQRTPIRAALNSTNTTPVAWSSSAAGRRTLTGVCPVGRIVVKTNDVTWVTDGRVVHAA